MEEKNMTYREVRLQEDDIRCHNQERADIRFQDGGLRHIQGASCYQVVRGAKNPAISPEGRGFTYNHAPMLAWFNGKFVLEYLGGPSGEHEPPSAAFVVFSEDGKHWEKPVEAFAPIELPSAPYCGPGKEAISGDTLPCIVHHRMGFYTSSSGRLLVMTFYGFSPDRHMAPNNGYGAGRAVREIYSDFTFSPVYWLRCNERAGYSRETAKVYPWYEESEDMGFVEACRELLKNRLVTQQWWEEERLDAEFFTRPGGRALSYYTLPSGRVMGVFKDSLTSWSDDGGETWSPLKKSTSIVTASGKVWGQRTPDGRYALVYNPSPDGAHRWPLAMQTGDNGIDFYGLAALVPEISPCRYEGKLKNLGAQYVRGITEANQKPEDQAMWITYSVNKEDIWVCRVPVPAEMVCREMVVDDLSQINEEKLNQIWNFYVPSWGEAALVKDEEGRQWLSLSDRDPWQRTRAMRMIKPGSRVEIVLELRVTQVSRQPAAVMLQDDSGQNPVIILFRPDGKLALRCGGADRVLGDYLLDRPLTMEITADAVENRAWIKAEGQGVRGILEGETAFAASVEQIERVLFVTKYYLPFQNLEINGKKGDIGNLPRADEPIPETGFNISRLEERSVWE